MAEIKEPSLIESIFGIGVIILVIVFVLGGCNSKEEESRPQDNYSVEQREHLMKLTNDFANEGLKSGLFKKVERLDDGENDCSYLFWTEESLWGNVPYEDKKSAQELIRHYAKVRGCFGATFRGYRTGKFL